MLITVAHCKAVAATPYSTATSVLYRHSNIRAHATRYARLAPAMLAADQPPPPSRRSFSSSTNSNAPRRNAQQMRAQIPLSVLVQSYNVDLESRGGSMKARCPFHAGGKERTPSLVVDDARGTYRCFACNSHGNIFDFVQEFEHCDFTTAVSRIAERFPATDSNTGAHVSYSYSSPAPKVPDVPEERLLLALQTAAELFAANLRQRSAEPCARVLRKRGIKRVIADSFGLGYSPPFPNDALACQLLTRGFSADELLAAGLVTRRGDEQELVDLFLGRLIIPIRNAEGSVVGFGARTLHDSEEAHRPKYINSQTSAVFVKGATLYGLQRARVPSSRADKVILVEGYMDAIALHAAGLGNVVATLGTAVTNSQLDLAASLSKSRRVILSLDADAAGEEAIMKLVNDGSLAQMTEKGVDVRVLTLPSGGAKDPDEFVRAHGLDAYTQLAERADGWIEWAGRRVLRAHAASAAESATGEPSSSTFAESLVQLRKLLEQAPAGARRLQTARLFALALANGSRPLAERVEPLLEPLLDPLDSVAGAAPHRAKSALPSMLGVDELFVLGESTPMSLHWRQGCCEGPVRSPRVSELHLPPCPLCAEDQLRDGAEAAVAELRGGLRARAEMLLLHALLRAPAVRDELRGALAGSKLELGTARRQSMLDALLDSRRPPKQAAEAVLEEMRALQPKLFAGGGELDVGGGELDKGGGELDEGGGELDELVRPSKELLADAAAWARVEGESSQSPSNATEGSTIVSERLAMRRLAERCLGILGSSTAVHELQQRAIRLAGFVTDARRVVDTLEDVDARDARLRALQGDSSKMAEALSANADRLVPRPVGDDGTGTVRDGE